MHSVRVKEAIVRLNGNLLFSFQICFVGINLRLHSYSRYYVIQIYNQNSRFSVKVEY